MRDLWINNCEGIEILPCLRDSKLACHSFMDASRRHKIPRSEAMGFITYCTVKQHEFHVCVSSFAPKSHMGNMEGSSGFILITTEKTLVRRTWCLIMNSKITSMAFALEIDFIFILLTFSDTLFFILLFSRGRFSLCIPRLFTI